MYGEDGSFNIALSVEDGPLESFYLDVLKLTQVLNKNGNKDYILDLNSNQIKIKFI